MGKSHANSSKKIFNLTSPLTPYSHSMMVSSKPLRKGTGMEVVCKFLRKEACMEVACKSLTPLPCTTLFWKWFACTVILELSGVIFTICLGIHLWFESKAGKNFFLEGWMQPPFLRYPHVSPFSKDLHVTPCKQKKIFPRNYMKLSALHRKLKFTYHTPLG